MTLVGVAPVTNLALALMTEPELAANVAQIVLMSGAWAEGNATPAAEFNALNDPGGARRAAGLRPAGGVRNPGVDRSGAGNPRPPRAVADTWSGRCLAAMCDIQASVPQSRRLPGRILHDPCAIAWLLRPDCSPPPPMFGAGRPRAGIGRGRTVIDRWNRTGDAHNAVVLERWTGTGSSALLGERLAGLP